MWGPNLWRPQQFLEGRRRRFRIRAVVFLLLAGELAVEEHFEYRFKYDHVSG